ncbi:MAG: phosphoribosylformylglycinamidine cyclo-ligase [Gammaproteobacteria bacterium]|nr:phosphoribosylformylglycinamidine cyclo-ligase [Gammaproteobacteria bacterium]
MGLTYKDAGVDIDAGNELVNRIKGAVKSTHREGVMSDIGGFGGLFELASHKYKNPILVSGTDGVGTKLKLAHQLNKHDTIGIDLVAMCVNDVIVQGAEPLFFLDYFATGKLEVEDSAAVVTGIAEGCKQAGAALIGGETAEMPGMYGNGEYDLAGFCVGVADKDKLITGDNINSGDVIIGMHSSGVHSNGFSLVNKLLEQKNFSLSNSFEASTLGETLLTPTKIYVKALLEIIADNSIHGLCHVTGGGITENLPRVLPDNVYAEVNLQSWKRLPIFDWIQEQGNVADEEMLRVFNCGIGMLVVAKQNDADSIINACSNHNINADVIGEVKTSEGASHVIYT